MCFNPLNLHAAASPAAWPAMAGLDEQKAPGNRLRVLTVFTTAEQRARVHAVCGALAEGSQCVDTATVTDAVLALLSGPVDLVLVDADAAGDLLPGLVLHMRRSAPRAGLLGFCNDDAATRMGKRTELTDRTAPSVIHPWSSLPQVVGDWVARWQQDDQAGLHTGTDSALPTPPRADA